MKSKAVISKSLAFLLMASLAGCATIRVPENYFFAPLAYDIAGERVEIQVKDGTRLVGRFLAHPQARATLVYFGGNAEYLDVNGKILRNFAEFRLNVLMVDYRGYGASGGVPSIDTFFSDSLSVFHYASMRPESRGLPTLAYGFSLGGYAAAYAAAHPAVGEPCAGLVLEATGTDVKSWVRLVLPWYYKPFVRVRVDTRLLPIDNAEMVRQFNGPLLVLGGGADRQAPAAMSRKLFAVSPSTQKNLQIFPLGKHGEIKDELEFNGIFSAFLEKIFASTEAPA